MIIINGKEVLVAPTISGALTVNGAISATGAISTATTLTSTGAANTLSLTTGAISATSMGGASCTATVSRINHYTGGGSYGMLRSFDTNITVAAGAGETGVASSTVFDAESCLIVGAMTKVTQAPGGGATEFKLYVTGGSTDGKLINARPVTLNSKSNSAEHNDGTQLPVVKPAAATTVTLMTNANVTGASLIVRVIVQYIQLSTSGL